MEPEPFKKGSAFLSQPKPGQNFADFKKRIVEQLRERGLMKEGEAQPQVSINKEEPESEDDEEGIRSDRLHRLRGTPNVEGAT